MKRVHYYLVGTLLLMSCSSTNVIEINVPSRLEYKVEAEKGIERVVCNETFSVPDIQDAPHIPENIKTQFDQNPDAAILELGDKLIEYKKYLEKYHERVQRNYHQYLQSCKK